MRNFGNFLAINTDINRTKSLMLILMFHHLCKAVAHCQEYETWQQKYGSIIYTFNLFPVESIWTSATSLSRRLLTLTAVAQLSRAFKRPQYWVFKSFASKIHCHCNLYSLVILSDCWFKPLTWADVKIRLPARAERHVVGPASCWLLLRSALKGKWEDR